MADGTMELEFKIRENLTEQFNLRVPASRKAQEQRAKGLGYDVPEMMRECYYQILDGILAKHGESDIPTLIVGVGNKLL